MNRILCVPLTAALLVLGSGCNFDQALQSYCDQTHKIGCPTDGGTPGDGGIPSDAGSAAVSLVPTSWDFGAVTTVDAGIGWNAVLFTLSHVAGAATVGPLTVVTTANDFKLAANLCTGASLSGSSSCKFSVYFQPSTAGTQSGAVRILDSDGTVLATASLTGVGVAPLETLSLTVTPIDGGVIGTGSQTCPPNCGPVQFTQGQTVTLSALASPTYGFLGWTGDCADAGMDASCSLSMDTNKAVGATFGQYNYMFVTSGSYNGNLGGKAGADAICGAYASDAGMPANRYVALLGFSNETGSQRLDGGRGWIRPDGKPFADTVGSLFNSTGPQIFYAPRQDERGNDLPFSVAWTGMNPDGNPPTGYNCSDWSSPDAGSYGQFGQPTWGSQTWIAASTQTCDQSNHLYCFGVNQNVPMRPGYPKGRRMFLSAPVPVGTGVAGLDSACQAQATAAGLVAGTNGTMTWSGSFKALVSTSSLPGISRFDAGAPAWWRVDGVQLSANATDWTAPNPTLWAAPNVLADGGYVTGYAYAWTGAFSPGVVSDGGGDNCYEWNTSDGGTKGLAGSPGSTWAFFPNNNPGNWLPCNSSTPASVYCLEE